MWEAKQLYESVVFEAKQVYRPEFALTPDTITQINYLIERICLCLGNDNKKLLQFCLEDYSQLADYLYCHTANVTVFSIFLGIAFGYDQQRLGELGMAAFLHDIGMVRYFDLINMNRKLTREEYLSLKEHPSVGIQILNNPAGLLSSNVIEAIRQEHERLDGSGYPSGKKEEEISEEARVIGLIDVYEALMHERPYRRKFTPLDAMKNILNNKSLFDQNIVKVIIEKIGIFPVGTVVRLNTKESGIVLQGSQRLPLRPLVNVVFDATGKKLSIPKRIDLADNSMIYIEECLNEYPKI